MIKKYIDKIVENDKPEDMNKLGDMLEEIIYDMKENNPEKFKEYKMKLYEMAYGKVLTKEMAEKWVEEMKPKAKWDYETTSEVKRQYEVEADDVSFYVVMNMMYSDMSNVLGEDVENYVEATKDWLNDIDVGKDKLYNYWKYVK